MRIFTDKGFRLQFILMTAALLLFTILGQLVVMHMADDYKQNMIAHDYGVAGSLTHSELDKTKILQAFTSEKTEDDLETGRELLQASGYTGSIQNNLLPEVEHFRRKFAVISLVLSIVFSAAILLLILYFALRRDKKLESANTDIQSFMSGNHHIRLNDHEEGSMSKFFTSLNALATSQAAHIAQEKQNKEFLKDTIADISHQLKTPLAALKMYNEIMQAEKIAIVVVESFLSKSERELNRMEILLQNLLKLARLDVGAIELNKSKQNLTQLPAKTARLS